MSDGNGVYFYVLACVFRIYIYNREREGGRKRGKERAISSDHRYMEIDGLLVGVKCGVRSVSLGVGDLVGEFGRGVFALGRGLVINTRLSCEGRWERTSFDRVDVAMKNCKASITWTRNGNPSGNKSATYRYRFILLPSHRFTQ